MPENPEVSNNGWSLRRDYDLLGNEESAAWAIENLLRDVRAAHDLGLAVDVHTRVYKAHVASYYVTVSDPLSYD